MWTLFKNFKPILLVVVLAATSLAILAKELESYLERPDIFTLKSQDHSKTLMQGWAELKKAHLEAAVMLVEMYKEHDLYFLARDSELLYDTTKMLLKNEPERLKKVHLLNISRANLRANNIKDYLKQEGITSDLLTQGKKVLFVDTGFSGSIPTTIRTYFPLEFEDSLQTHLITSTTGRYPSTRVFLTAIDSNAPKLTPDSLKETILSYENMPRYTNTSSQFELQNGQWHPMSTTQKMNDSNISKELATAYAQDLKLYLESDSVKSFVSQRQKIWREVLSSAKSGDKTLLVNKLKAVLENPELGPYGEAIVRDFFEAAEKNKIANIHSLKLHDVGLKHAIQIAGDSNKLKILADHPEWRDILLDPYDTIPKLLANKEMTTLEKIISSNLKDYSFFTTLAAKIGEEDTPQNRRLIKLFIEHGKSQMVINSTFQFQPSASMLDLSEPIIVKAVKENDKTMLQALIALLARPHTKDAPQIFKLLIQKAIEAKNIDVLKYMIFSVFPFPHTQNMATLYKLVLLKMVEHKDDWALDRFRQIMKMSHTQDDSFKLIREVVDNYDRRNPDWDKMQKILTASQNCFRLILNKLTVR